MIFDPALEMKSMVFEVTSALFTVGSSLGATSLLSDESKILLCIAMLLGRVGIISICSGFLYITATYLNICPKKILLLTDTSPYSMRYLIIGLGIYGSNLALDLTAQGHEVIGADISRNTIDSIKDYIATAYVLDTTEEASLGVLPIHNVDLVIVAIGENFGASVKTVALLKKSGVKRFTPEPLIPCTCRFCKVSISTISCSQNNVQPSTLLTKWLLATMWRL